MLATFVVLYSFRKISVKLVSLVSNKKAINSILQSLVVTINQFDNIQFCGYTLSQVATRNAYIAPEPCAWELAVFDYQ